jgi:hypothetical protein
MSRNFTFLCLVLMSACALPLRGGTIPMTFVSPGLEDSTGLNIDYIYGSPTSGQLGISGSGITVLVSQNAGSSFRRYLGDFNLQASINPSTGQASAGSISLVLQNYPGTLQTIWNSTNLTNFGFASNMLELDFAFIQSGPSILLGAQDGSNIGIKVFPVAGYLTANPSWGADFHATGAKNDGGVVPTPSAASAGLVRLGLMGVGVLWRRAHALT